jgi:hypothetical protein
MIYHTTEAYLFILPYNSQSLSTRSSTGKMKRLRGLALKAYACLLVRTQITKVDVIILKSNGQGKGS